MHKVLFSKPVTVSVGVVGEPVHLLSADQAIDMLSRHWRIEGGLKQKDALRACRLTVSGAVGAETARHEVVLAAREANMLVE